MPIGHGKRQNEVYDWLDSRPNAQTTTEVAAAFNKPTKWAYRILSSLEDAYRIGASAGRRPNRWFVIKRNG